VAGPLLVASMTTNPALVAGAVFAQQLPWLLFALPAGAYVDRLDRRRLLVVVNLARGAGLYETTRRGRRQGDRTPAQHRPPGPWQDPLVARLLGGYPGAGRVWPNCLSGATEPAGRGTGGPDPVVRPLQVDQAPPP